MKHLSYSDCVMENHPRLFRTSRLTYWVSYLESQPSRSLFLLLQNRRS